MENDRLNGKSGDTKVIAFGFLLILGVSLFTLGRNYLPTDEPEDTKDASQFLENEKKIEARKITVSELSSEYRNRSIEIWDLRDEENFRKSHILDSKNISPDDMKGALERHDPSKKYILVDDTGEIARVLMAGFITDDAFKNIYYLEGGMMAWKDETGNLIGEGDPFSINDQSKVTYVNCDELKEMIERQGAGSFYIIDVRTSSGYADGHIAGAENINLQDLEARRKSIPMGKKIVIYDNDGLWAFQGAVRLADMGIMNVLALSDGLDSWKQKGFEVEK